MASPERSSSIATATDSDACQRITEIGAILAAGLSRLEARKSSRKSADFGESSLHFMPDQSGHTPSRSAEAFHD
jgi:hypothetical protein